MLLEVFSFIKFVMLALTPVMLYLAPGEDDPDDVPLPDPGPTDPPADGTGTDPYTGFAVTCTSVSRTLVSVNQGARTATYTLVGSYTGNTALESIYRGHNGYKDGVKVYATRFGGGTQSSATFYSYTPGDWGSLECDNPLYSWKAFVDNGSDGAGGALYTFKSAAVTATASAPSSSSVAATGATISCLFYPNTLYSTCTAQLQYKRTVDSTWINAGASAATASYNQQTITRVLTGLTAATSYDIRLVLTRTTVNDTTLTSATTSFTTLADTPTLTTDAASNLGNTSATLNATIDPNNVTDGADVYFKWDTVSPPVANTTASENFTGDTAQTAARGITGLTPSTLYYYQAFASWSPSGAASGTILSFTTAADPAAEAAEEARMQVYEYKRKYGVILTAQPLFFTLQTPSGTNSNTFVVNATVAAADCLISKDGGAFAQTTNQPVTLGNGYTLVLTAAEMQANEIDIIIKDAAGGPDFRDCHLRVITNVQLGSVDIDAATGAKSNTTAFKATGYGTGNGIEAVAGATGQDINGVLAEMVLRTGFCQASTTSTAVLDTSASANNDHYVGAVIMIVAGKNVGQARIITDYVASTKTCSLNANWTEAPDTTSRFVIIGGDDPWGQTVTGELSALPSATVPSFSQMVQFLYQRFRMKRTQTAIAFSMFKNDGSTALGSGGVDDDGTTQTHEKMS